MNSMAAKGDETTKGERNKWKKEKDRKDERDNRVSERDAGKAMTIRGCKH
jgi:hypothetical protein